MRGEELDDLHHDLSVLELDDLDHDHKGVEAWTILYFRTFAYVLMMIGAEEQWATELMRSRVCVCVLYVLLFFCRLCHGVACSFVVGCCCCAGLSLRAAILLVVVFSWKVRAGTGLLSPLARVFLRVVQKQLEESQENLAY